MWTRRELKECAKQLLKINYWKAVLAGVILSLIGGSGVVSVVERSSSGSFDEVIGAVETDDFGLVLGIALGIVAVALLVNFIMTILIWNPLEVGCKKLFIQCEYGTAETRCIWSVINRRDGKNVGWIMFLRTLFVSLWSLLFIIPGIIKQYEYMMIPFLLAEKRNVTLSIPLASGSLRGVSSTAKRTLGIPNGTSRDFICSSICRAEAVRSAVSWEACSNTALYSFSLC